jgi:hypothetical protein
MIEVGGEICLKIITLHHIQPKGRDRGTFL